MTDPALDAGTLAAVGELWKRQHRVVESKFAGESMRPTIAPSDEVRIECGRRPAVGDIVLFTYRGRVVLHRIEELLTGGFVITRGDANAVGDFPVRESDIIGVATAVRRDASWVLPTASQTPAGFVEKLNRAVLRRSKVIGELWLAVRWRLRAIGPTLRRFLPR